MIAFGSSYFNTLVACWKDHDAQERAELGFSKNQH
jgi:hypothetical protein